MLTKLDKETIDLMCKYKLTLTQLGICLLIHEGDAASLIRINTEVATMGNCYLKQGDKYVSELKDLVNRGFIIQISKSPELSNPNAFDNFKVAEHFSKLFLEPLKNATEELLNVYPDKLFVSGNEFPAKSCVFENLEKAYLLGIKNSITKHKEVIARVTAFRERNRYAQVGIEKFVGGRLWESLEDLTRPKARGY